MPTRYAGSCHCGDRFRLKTPEGKLATYEFHQHRISQMAAVNARTLEGIDLSGLPKKQFNERAL